MIHVGKPSFGSQEVTAVSEVMQSTNLTQGRRVADFESAFAAYIGVEHAIAVSNGTVALHLALIAAGVGPGDEVIVPATTFIATVNAVTYVGATPVIVDVHPTTWCIDTNEIRKHITPRTKAIIPVHVFGVPADMVEINRIAWQHKLAVIEDAAEALGASIAGKQVGAWGDLATFSFYGNKTISTGEGGMVVTNDPANASLLRRLRGQGQIPHTRYLHDILGYNYRMTELQAAIGCVQLAKLPTLLKRRQQVAEQYYAALPQVQFQRPMNTDQHGYWMVAAKIRAHAKDVVEMLYDAGIETRPVFPPLHIQPTVLPGETDPTNTIYMRGQVCPQAEHLYQTGIVLPTHAELTYSEVEYVAEQVAKYA